MARSWSANARERSGEPRGWVAILKCPYFRGVWWVGQNKEHRRENRGNRLASPALLDAGLIIPRKPVFGNRREPSTHAPHDGSAAISRIWRRIYICARSCNHCESVPLSILYKLRLDTPHMMIAKYL
ncbi:hypothetical protein RSAG8_11466, partial [Rhizoctonia solani AG-8 WAC10335]